MHADVANLSLFLALILIVPPVWRILNRVGFSGWWSLVAVIPLVNLVALWMFAFGRWPASAR